MKALMVNLPIDEASKLLSAGERAHRPRFLKLKNDIIFTKSFRNIFAGEYMSVEPDFSPEGQPNGKLAEECFAPHQKNSKETRKDPQKASAGRARKKSKFGGQKAADAPNL